MPEIPREKIVVYTAIFDDYDILIDPKNPGSCTYICFTDNPNLNSDVWEIKQFDGDMSPTMKNRKVKILPHKYFSEFEYSVYIDGNVQICSNITKKVDYYLSTNDIVVPNHPLRDCIYQEAEACINSEKADSKKIREQMEKYRKKGFPENMGLSENKIIFRCHNKPKIKRTMENWWDELESGAKRDQLSLPFVLWQNNLEYQFLKTNPRQASSDFNIHPHRPANSGIASWKVIAWKMFVNLKANKKSNIVNQKFYNIVIKLFPHLEQNTIEREQLSQ